jgi:hypothetical protein
MHSFLGEARERYTAWGCEPKCTKDATESIEDMRQILNCKCPPSMTISGDTSQIY